MEGIKFTFEDLKVHNKVLDFIDMVYVISSDLHNDENLGLVPSSLELQCQSP